MSTYQKKILFNIEHIMLDKQFLMSSYLDLFFLISISCHKKNFKFSLKILYTV